MTIPRRHLLFGAAPFVLGAQPAKFKTALIGSGWWGMNILATALEAGQSQLVAVCDVDESQLNAALEKLRPLTSDQPRRYKDYREMLAKERPDIVIVATPDHWHALAAIASVTQGAHVYVEKPIAHTLMEGRAMVNAARGAKRVVQVGTHRRVSPHNVSAREFLREGRAGRIGMVRSFVLSAGGPGQKTPDSDPPLGLDWNLWLGPAPARPYNKAIHPRGFRQFVDFANGTIGDWGIHWFDQILWILDGEQYPKRVFSTAARRVRQDASDAPDTQLATFEFEKITVQWEHRLYGGNPAERTAIGCYFYGDEGTLHLGWRDGWTFYPTDSRKPTIHKDPELHKPDEQNIRELWADFLDAIRADREPVSDILKGHYSTSMSLLAMASWRAGKALDWDGAKETITNDKAANRLLRREYRAPFKYPAERYPKA